MYIIEYDTGPCQGWKWHGAGGNLYPFASFYPLRRGWCVATISMEIFP